MDMLPVPTALNPPASIRELRRAVQFYDHLLSHLEMVRTGPRLEFSGLAAQESLRCKSVLTRFRAALRRRTNPKRPEAAPAAEKE